MSALLDDIARITASSISRREAFRLVGGAVGGALLASLGLGRASRGWGAPAGGAQGNPEVTEARPRRRRQPPPHGGGPATDQEEGLKHCCPKSRRAPIMSAVRAGQPGCDGSAAPEAGAAIGRPAVPQTRRAAINVCFPPATWGAGRFAAAGRGMCAAVAGAAARARPQAILALTLLVNSSRMARLVLVAESRTRIGLRVT